jgi:uncharacterized protein (TIGR02145 family)
MKYVILIICFSFTGIAMGQSFKCGDVLKDPRDGREYKSVKIGNQCWMAENLNAGKQVPDHKQKDNEQIEKTCYENDPDNCLIYGGLYTWDEMMQYSTEPNVQGICPEGWHVPSKQEWELLVKTLGKNEAGQKMKVTKQDDPSWDGNNSSGFAALPSGAGNTRYFHRKGDWALFWSSSQEDDDYAWFSQLDGYWYPQPPKYKKLYIGNYYMKLNGFSVRCIKD